MTPKFTMLVGLPGTGKSTYVEAHDHLYDDPVVLSTDAFIEARAERVGKTYNDVWAETISEAEADMWERFSAAIKARRDIIVDRTNLTRKSRARFLAQLPSTYVRTAVVLYATEGLLGQRLAQRPGKTIPMDVIERMASTYIAPSREEGFHTILQFNQQEDKAA